MAGIIRWRRAGVIVLATVAVVAAGAALAWTVTNFRTPKGHDGVPSTDDLLRRAGVAILGDERASMSFPKINVWEAPSWPVGAGRVLTSRGAEIFDTGRKGWLWRGASLQVSREMYPKLQEAARQEESRLWELVRSAAKHANLEPPFSKGASRVVAVTWLAWAASAQERSGTCAWLLEGSIIDEDFEDKISEQPLEWWQEIVVRDGVVWLEREATPMRPATSHEHRPLHPKAGQTALLGGMHEMRFTRREIVRVNGATLRCWILEGTWTEDSREDKHVALYAPGIGKILKLAWIREPTGKGLFGRRVTEQLLVDVIEELLVPEESIYWHASEGAE